MAGYQRYAALQLSNENLTEHIVILSSRLKSVWGEDADIWRPQRFLEGVERYQTTSLGVMSNM